MKINVTPEIEHALQAGAPVLSSVSGGKDSMAHALALSHARQENGWKGLFLAGHADLGRMDWPDANQMSQRCADMAGFDLTVVQAKSGDLLDIIERRRQYLAGTGKPFWPSPAQRYCTSDAKRGPLDIVARSMTPAGGFMIVADGIRAEESPGRAKKNIVEFRPQISAERLVKLRQDGACLGDLIAERKGTERLGFTWHPILSWPVESVWAIIGTSQAELDRRRNIYKSGDKAAALAGWPAAPAYVYGASRYSCMICIMSSQADIRVGAEWNRWLYGHLRQMETNTGFTFQQGHTLADVVEDAKQQDSQLGFVWDC